VSLGIVIKGPEGLVLAAESRVTLSAKLPDGQQTHVSFDNATKLLSFSDPNKAVGVVTYGLAAIGMRTAHSFVPEFEAGLPKERLKVGEFAERLGCFFMQQWKAIMPADYAGPDMVFVVGGFDEGEPYGRVYLLEVPRNPRPVETNANPGEFGITWGGQREHVDRLLLGFDPRLPEIVTKALELSQEAQQALQHALRGLQMQLPLSAMPLQECVNLAIFFLRTTISAQRLSVGIRGCGGPIDVATITRRDGLTFVQRKEVTGEAHATPEGGC
jgi:hypothetical protein